MARWIQTDGTDTMVAPANGGAFILQEMNIFVGGYLEAIKLTDTLVMYINEDGIRLHLPMNIIATRVLRANCVEHMNTIIVGNVLIASMKETGDED